MTAKDLKEKYRTNEIYLNTVIKRDLDNNAKNKPSKNYMILVRLRKRRWELRESISKYRYKIRDKQKALVYLSRKIEVAELAWGKERGLRKRISNKTSPNVSAVPLPSDERKRN